MLPIFFHRQNPRHIGKRHIGLILQEIPQKVKVLPLQSLLLLSLTHHTVPLVDQKDKLLVCFRINLLQHGGKPQLPLRKQFPIFLTDFGNDSPLQIFNHSLSLRPDQKLLHIQKDNLILIQMLPERLLLFDLKPSEQVCRIAAAAVVGGKHLERHGLAKAPGPADTDIFLFGIDQLINACDQSRLIHINFRTD